MRRERKKKLTVRLVFLPRLRLFPSFKNQQKKKKKKKITQSVVSVVPGGLADCQVKAPSLAYITEPKLQESGYRNHALPIITDDLYSFCCCYPRFNLCGVNLNQKKCIHIFFCKKKKKYVGKVSLLEAEQTLVSSERFRFADE